MDEKGLHRKGNTFFWNDRKIGIAKGRRFVTHRNGKHKFRKYNGFGLNKNLLHRLKSTDIDRIVLHYHKKGERKVCRITPKKALEVGIDVQEEGFEEQLVVKEGNFRLREIA